MPSRVMVCILNHILGIQNTSHPTQVVKYLNFLFRLPLQPCAPVMPTLSAAFVDENLPDGTHLQPGTKFIKHWRMKNTGNVKWSTDTKVVFPTKCECEVVEMAECLTDRLSFSCYYSFQLKFMWGNLTLASTEKKDVLVPCLKAGHVGVVSVEFIAPTLEGTYTSHWRLSHKGQQFGPRVWCSIIVDPFPSTESPDNSEKSMISSSRGDELPCQQEVSIGRACSQLVDPSETWKGQLLPSAQTHQYAYIGPSLLGLCVYFESACRCPSVLNPGCYLVHSFLIFFFFAALAHRCCTGFH